ncbi:hypothetical protein M440DRAFT_1352697 [Trichoderma longibrachiatum ATCC 18648]|uniref:Zn(2)-C6 fungal-type domain-containing protein n=1 Tax=Trichoderma longibrachiatum ATCC 18648 TaxID=983965 RepID=A0A2T4CBF8_TRILO|nr:hypothetical protein M440DRAFT_1352697 [Trichoderma longibrachiatum ATCC 18648]
MDTDSDLGTRKAGSPKPTSGTRVSLACLPCRTRHVRCDAKKPRCNRCREEDKECSYAKSRRGGLDRAALAARRNQAAALAAAKNSSSNSNSNSNAHSSNDGSSSNGQLSPAGSNEGSRLTSGLLPAHHPEPPPAIDPSLYTPPDEAWSSILPSADLQSLDLAGDAFIDAYYSCFHRYHPCAPPRRFLERYLQDPIRQDELRPLVCVMRFVGGIYLSSHQPSLRPRCRELEDLAASAISRVAPTAINFFMVPCHAIFSACMYWRGHTARSRHHMNTAIQLALDFGMHRREFAVDHGDGNPVLEECWRRTWWQVYIIDAYYAAIKRNADFATFHVDATTDLPCEEDEYERGEIPRPKTIEEFESREFSSEDTVFSSFAYLVGGVRGMASAMARVLDLPASNASESGGPSPKVLESVDSITEGWLLLLPESKRDIFSADGQVDELIFQAMMALHATTVGLHRPFSNCAFDPLECISSCSAPPTTTSLSHRSDSGAEFRLIHTIKCIRAAEAQIGLLALPTRPCSHTPFVVCMLTTGTLALLAACRYILRGPELAVARDQIRMSIGCHKAMAAVWPQAGSNLHEVQAIAREVLGLPTGSTGTSSGSNGTSSKQQQAKTPIHEHVLPSPGPPPSMSGPDSSSDSLSPFPLDGLQTYWNMSSLQPDLPFQWWSGSEGHV